MGSCSCEREGMGRKENTHGEKIMDGAHRCSHARSFLSLFLSNGKDLVELRGRSRDKKCVIIYLLQANPFGQRRA